MDTISHKLRKRCEENVRKGGHCEQWPQVDGVKTLCLDKIYKNIVDGTCLIYSFGLAKDWTFEEIMARLGCQVNETTM